ncbi:KEOPS complex subunit Pcc1 [Halorubrum tibetense]|uniref:KEOPS complex subunit Pcc1 n=1 Tax=Halorubrum tibetense TaxID=175631 RepID=A0ABD5SCM9_9EURY
MIDDSSTDPSPTDKERTEPVADRDHEAVLSFRYATDRRARHIAGALAPEVGDLDESRSAATVDRGTDRDDVVRVRIVADDLVALRAGIRSWSRLVAVAEDVTRERP